MRRPTVWVKDASGKWVDRDTLPPARLMPAPPPKPVFSTAGYARAEKPVERCSHCGAAGYHLTWCRPAPEPPRHICNGCGGLNMHYDNCPLHGYAKPSSEYKLPYEGPAFTHFKPWPIVAGVQEHLKPRKRKSKRQPRRL